MSFSLKKHAEFKNQAIQAIKAHTFTEFLNISRDAAYTKKVAYEEYIYPEEGGIWENGGINPIDVKIHYRNQTEKYLENSTDYKDFLNLALVENNKQVIDYVFKKYISNQNLNPVLFSQDTFRLHSIQNGCTQDSLENLDKIFSQLYRLEKKIINLEKRKSGKADYAYQIAKYIQMELITYASSENKELGLSTFKDNCLGFIESISSSRNLFQGNEGTDFLLNLTLAILGLGVVYLAAATANYYATDKKHFFFHIKTETEEICDELKHSVACV